MRKENHTFYFSVEGQTEEMYLEWLQRKINTTPEAKCTVKFNTKIEKNPLSYIKSLTTIGKVEVTHIFDYESSDQQHKDLFLETLKNNGIGFPADSIIISLIEKNRKYYSVNEIRNSHGEDIPVHSPEHSGTGQGIFPGAGDGRFPSAPEPLLLIAWGHR